MSSATVERLLCDCRTREVRFVDIGDGYRTVVVIVDGAEEAVVGHFAGVRYDLALVEALARVQLEAGRRGCSIRLRGACPQLCELLELVGLGDLVG